MNSKLNSELNFELNSRLEAFRADKDCELLLPFSNAGTSNLEAFSDAGRDNALFKQLELVKPFKKEARWKEEMKRRNEKKRWRVQKLHSSNLISRTKLILSQKLCLAFARTTVSIGAANLPSVLLAKLKRSSLSGVSASNCKTDAQSKWSGAQAKTLERPVH